MVKSPPVQFEKSTGSLVRYHWQIAKVPLCLLVSFSSLFGFLLASRRFTLDAGIVFAAVLLLSCGAASLNSYQEYRFDRLMQRTRERPLARGLLSPQLALLQARMLIIFGLLLLFISSDQPGPVSVGTAAVVLYNYIYTPLKYQSVWALIPGALCGALPPLIGWLAGGGRLDSPVILIVVVLLAVWQIPHFWLVVLENREDYQSGILPSMIKLMPERNLRLLAVVWVASLVTIIHLLIIQLVFLPNVLRWAVSISGLLMSVYFGIKMCGSTRPDYRFLFMLLNGFMFLLMFLFSLGSIVG